VREAQRAIFRWGLMGAEYFMFTCGMLLARTGRSRSYLAQPAHEEHDFTTQHCSVNDLEQSDSGRSVSLR
jgi:hypothetical protein